MPGWGRRSPDCTIRKWSSRLASSIVWAARVAPSAAEPLCGGRRCAQHRTRTLGARGRVGTLTSHDPLGNIGTCSYIRTHIVLKQTLCGLGATSVGADSAAPAAEENPPMTLPWRRSRRIEPLGWDLDEPTAYRACAQPRCRSEGIRGSRCRAPRLT